MMKNGTKLYILLAVLVLTLSASYAHFELNAPDSYKNTEFDEKKGELQSEIDRLQNSIEENRRQYEAQAELLQGQERELALLEVKAMEQNSLIDRTNANIAAKELEITAKEAEVSVARKKVDEQISSLRKRLRTMYKFGKTGYLEILLNSDSLINAMTRMDRIRIVTEYDKNLLFELKASKETLEIAKGKLETEKKNMEALKEEQIQQKEALERTYEQVAEKKRQTENNIAFLNRKIAEFQEEQDFWDRELRKLTVKRAYVGGEMVWPLDFNYNIVTSIFGERDAPVPGASTNHGAIDIAAPTGALIYSTLEGTVIVSEYSGGYGNLVIVDHGGGITTTYAHLSTRYVAAGQDVVQGQAVGEVGSTGYSTGPHLHYEVRINGDRVDPLPYFDYMNYVIMTHL